jgi:hypothetical protein
MWGSRSGLAGGWGVVSFRASARFDQGRLQGADSLLGVNVELDH